METTADPEKSKLDICTVATLPVMGKVTQERHNVYTITLYEISMALETKNLQEELLEEVIP
jgi:hypothetical protein